MSDKKTKAIYPLAYELQPNLHRTLYYVGFPSSWKKDLINLYKLVKRDFKGDEYGLPTKELKTFLLSWLDDVIDMGSLSLYSNDSYWLTSLKPLSKADLEELCSYIRVWVRSTFKSKDDDTVKEKAELFCQKVSVNEFENLLSEEDEVLTLENGSATGKAYGVVPFLAVNKLVGKTVKVQDTPLKLCYLSKNEVISAPLEDIESKNKYSFVFQFSLQTAPNCVKAIFLCHMSIRRWIYEPWNDEKLSYPQDKIAAHIKVADNKYCKVNIRGEYSSKKIYWDSLHEKCYNISHYNSLPSAEAVIKNPKDFSDSILLPYKNGMAGFKESRIGTGVSVLDKAQLHKEISRLLEGLISDNLIEAVKQTRRGKIDTYKSPKDYESTESFRQWVKSSTDTSRIVFELYGLWSDKKQKELLEAVENKIRLDFGENTIDSCMEIKVVHKEINDIANGLEKDDKGSQICFIADIEERIGEVSGVTACVVLIPDAETYAKLNLGDPKKAIRNAFAKTGRLTQFITPNDLGKKAMNEKINHTVYDLYRQLGIVTLLAPPKKDNWMLSVPVFGFYVNTQIQGKNKKGRFLPLVVCVDLQSGKTYVSCNAFKKHTVLYREACLELAKLYWDSDLEEYCKEASFQPAKQLLLNMRNKYPSIDDKMLLTCISDGNTRPLWDGISNKEIERHEEEAPYCPKSVNVGKQKAGYELSLLDYGIRIMRIRINQEVPDYFTDLSVKSTEEKEQRASNKGIFKYNKIFYAIAERPFDDKYLHSCTHSRVNYPEEYFAEKDMAELYPLQLQTGDNVMDWLSFTDALRNLSLQYNNRPTILPLPLHLAKCLEEYIFSTPIKY